MEDIKNIFYDSETVLFNKMIAFLSNYNYDLDKAVITEQYIYAIGEIPVILVAHVDTVFPYPPIQIYHDQEAKVIWSPTGLGADDKAGIYAILKLLESGYRPSIIITRGEEKGGVGARALIQDISMPLGDEKFIIQLDRQGFDDAVYYNCKNKAFERYVNSFGFDTAKGSFSDISFIAPAWDLAAVNLSVGYLNEHTVSEHWYYEACIRTINKVAAILLDVTYFERNKFHYHVIADEELDEYDFSKMEEYAAMFDYYDDLSSYENYDILGE